MALNVKSPGSLSFATPFIKEGLKFSPIELKNHYIFSPLFFSKGGRGGFHKSIARSLSFGLYGI